MRMKEIGGFLNLELREGKAYHQNAIKLNSGRSAFKLILKQKNIHKIYLPYYICGCIPNILKEYNIQTSFYNLDQTFFPLQLPSLAEHEYFFYVDYFGINSKNSTLLCKLYKNIIIDNTQSFFTKSIKNTETFYSARKFIGVADGGYLYTNSNIDLTKFNRDISHENYEYLLKRLEFDASDVYPLFLANEKEIENKNILLMSNLTKKILQSLNYRHIKNKRNKNFLYLCKYFKNINQIKINIKAARSPLVYPLLVKNGESIKKKLIQNKIYVPTYWEEVLQTVDKNSFEYNLTKNLISLPIDQRYDFKDMKKTCYMVQKSL